MTDSRHVLREAVLALLWDQWTELGVAGIRKASSAIIDPEALLLATLSFARHDPRLFDEALDWLVSFGAMLDAGRLRRLATRLDPDTRRLAHAVVELMRERSSESKWSPIAERWRAEETRTAYAPAALFLSADDSPLPVFGESEPFFAERGFLRGPLELRGLSASPALDRPALLRLRARALTGLGVRAETLLYLWTHSAAHGRLIAERAGYSQRQVADYLSSLSDARFADRFEVGKTIQYRLRPEMVAIAGQTVRYVDWPRTFEFLRGLFSTLSTVLEETDNYERSVCLRAGFETLRSSLPIEGFDVPPIETERYPGTQMIDYSREYVVEIADRIAALT